MRILVASDKFKGSLTAGEACTAIAEGLQAGGCHGGMIQCIPVADGGDGIARTLTDAQSGTWKTCEVADALGSPVAAGYGLIETDRLAIIEMAEASGLALLGNRQKVPWSASTFGTGQLILDAIARGAETIILGIGGSATNDGGAGMARALGWRFLDFAEADIPRIPEGLPNAVTVREPENLKLPRILVACDVDNPLLGPQGCTRVYGPQKGIEENDFKRHEARLEHLVSLLGDFARAVATEPGAGAAGGLGFGARVFARAELRPGFALVAEQLDLESRIAEADLVITGEGKLDAQTGSGKAPAGVLQLARKHGKPVFAFCGMLEEGAGGDFDRVIEIRDPNLGVSENMAKGAIRLRESAAASVEAIRSCVS